VALAVFHPFVSAQSSCDKPFVVSQVTLPSTTHLSGSEQAAIRARLIGRCIDDQKLTDSLASFKTSFRVSAISAQL
jgi:hypothetical protein